jgi:hypothetical protein
MMVHSSTASITNSMIVIETKVEASYNIPQLMNNSVDGGIIHILLSILSAALTNSCMCTDVEYGSVVYRLVG